MSYTPFNAPLLSPLLGDSELTQFFTVKSELAAMLAFEAALASAQAACDVIPSAAGDAVAKACQTFVADVAAIGEATSRDGVVVAEFVRQLRQHVGEPHRQFVHFGSTSQDVIDTSLVLRLRDVVAILDRRLEHLSTAFDDLEQQHGQQPLMARTRMQAAIEISAADRIRTWRGPVDDNRRRLSVLRPQFLRLQLGGAAGTLEKLGNRAEEVRQKMAEILEIGAPAQTWHADRSAFVEFANWLSLVSGSLGKFGQDVALMAQNGIGEIKVTGAGGSSAMAHKQNPIKAEILVSLARFNACLGAGMHQALVHEQERSGAAWTLEWMILPQMVIVAGAATRTAISLAESIEEIGTDGSIAP